MIRLSKCALSDKEMAAVTTVLKGEYLGMGPEVQALENELKTFFGSEGIDVACVCNGTAALQLALQAVGVDYGDEVLVPTLTYLSSFQAVSALGAIPVACDVDLATGLLNLEDAAKRITEHTKAVMPVHYTGNAGDLGALYNFAEIHHLRVIEDAAHAFGTTYKGDLIGSIGDLVCFSFDGIKNITCGEGGAIVSRDKSCMSKIKDLRLLGVEKDSEKRYNKQRSWEFDVVEQGWRFHMSDIMAAIGRVQLKRFNQDFAPRRISLMKYYREQLSAINNIQLFDIHPDNNVVPHLMSIRVLNNYRNALREFLLEQGIQVGIHYKPNHLLSKYVKLGVSLPIADQLYQEILTLPLHVDLTFEEADYVIQHIRQFMLSNVSKVSSEDNDKLIKRK